VHSSDNDSLRRLHADCSMQVPPFEKLPFSITKQAMPSLASKSLSGCLEMSFPGSLILTRPVAEVELRSKRNSGSRPRSLSSTVLWTRPSGR
jgi:hypothetical protein